MDKELQVVESCDVPENPESGMIYRLLPKNVDEEYYRERTDRNIGWITREEQDILRNSVVGIAGCGGMGGQLAQIFTRLGIGEIRIADCESFDISNINRQFAAFRSTVGKNKALETARMLRTVSDDLRLTVYVDGVCDRTVGSFVAGCDVICDEIDFWALGARILLHKYARDNNVSLFNCNTIGFGTRLFLFTPSSMTMEECLGFSYQEGLGLQIKIQSKKASMEEIRLVANRMYDRLFPELPEYSVGCKSNRDTILERTILGKAPILATNPSMATGFLADRVLLYLLRNSPRSIVQTPETPGYLYFDAARMEAKAVQGKWW